MAESAARPDPKTVPPRVSRERYHRDISTARKEGELEGLEKGRKEILDWLEKEYTKPGAPDRGSPEALAILKVTTAAAKYFRRRVEQDQRNQRFRRGVSR